VIGLDIGVVTGVTVPSFATLSTRFLTRMRTRLDSVRASMGLPDNDALQVRLRSLAEAAGSFGYHDVALLAGRAAALCDVQPMQFALVTKLLDDIEAAHEAHVRTSTLPAVIQPMSNSRQCSEG